MLHAEQIAPEAFRPLRRTEFERMVELGMFEDEQVELLRGSLVAMSPQGSAHSDAVARLTALLVKGLPDSAQLRPQCAFEASDLSEPEPDLAVVEQGDYRDAHPASALLVIEIAGTSLRKDREVKGLIYAECGIPEYWIVNLPQQCFEVYRRPCQGRYAESQTASSGQSVCPLAFPELSISVEEVLGPLPAAQDGSIPF